MIFNRESRLHSMERKEAFKNSFEVSKMTRKIKALAPEHGDNFDHWYLYNEKRERKKKTTLICHHLISIHAL